MTRRLRRATLPPGGYRLRAERDGQTLVDIAFDVVPVTRAARRARGRGDG